MHTKDEKLKQQLEKKLTHYTGKAIDQFSMLSSGDRVLIGLSGGKDSYTMVKILHLLQKKYRGRLDLHAYTLDQGQPGWNDVHLRAWLESNKYSYTIESRDTYSVVTDKIPEGKTYCSLCSRLRRGNIYRFARDNGFNKIALGHHRDDLIQSLLMSILYNGEIKSMPPKLLTDDKQLMVVRPMALCQEKDIAEYAKLSEFPIIPCNLCGSQENLARKKVGKLIRELSKDNEKIPSNMLRALSKVIPSHLMDKNIWDFNSLETQPHAQHNNEKQVCSDICS